MSESEAILRLLSRNFCASDFDFPEVSEGGNTIC